MWIHSNIKQLHTLVLLNVNFAMLHVGQREKTNSALAPGIVLICLMADHKTKKYYYIHLTNIYSLHAKT